MRRARCAARHATCKYLGMSANGAILWKNPIQNHFLALGLNKLVGTRGMTPNPGGICSLTLFDPELAGPLGPNFQIFKF